MEQKIIITGSEHEINKYIDMGWLVITIVPSSTSGEFCFLLERK